MTVYVVKRHKVYTRVKNNSVRENIDFYTDCLVFRDKAAFKN